MIETLLLSNASPSANQELVGEVEQIPEGLSLGEADALEIPAGNVNPHAEKLLDKLSEKKGFFYKLAPVLHSRESSYRVALDVVAYDLPNVAAAATRGIANFVERIYENFFSTSIAFFSPYMFHGLAHLFAPKILAPEELPDKEFLLLLRMEELDNKETFLKGIERIAAEEPEDQNRMAKFMKVLGRGEKALEGYRKRSEDIKDFCQRMQASEYSDGLRERVKKLKMRMLTVESGVEGILTSTVGPAVRLIRKFFFKLDRFSGTTKYLSEEESKKIEANEGTSLGQKLGTVFSIISAPLLNQIWFKMTKDTEEVKKSGFRKMLHKHIDVNHGYFANLGQLFTMLTVPKWTGLFAAAQKYELFERVLNFITLIPSFLLGDRVSNGRLAKYYDKYLVEKYGVEPGILVEKEHLSEAFPEQAKYEYVRERLKQEDNLELVKEADSLYRKVMYGGFGLHSLGLFILIMLNQYATKLMVRKDVKEAESKKAKVGGASA